MNPVKEIRNWFEIPPRLLAIRHVMKAPGARVLDVGCGNHSPTMTKKYFPRCVYHGVDSTRWNRDAADDRAIDKFYDVDLEEVEKLEQIENGCYDAVVCSHVLEHITQPYEVAAELAKKLGPGGVLYIEAPSERSLKLPRAVDGWMGIKGCLNFYDDVTHRTMVDMQKMKTVLEAQGCTVTPPRYRFGLRRVLLLPAYVVAGIVLRGYIPASVVWDITGFAKYIVARQTAVGA